MAAQQTLNPFSASEIALAQSIVQGSDEALALFAKCHSCQADMSSFIEQVNAVKSLAVSVLREFGGNPRP
jgi:hypothetical protein